MTLQKVSMNSLASKPLPFLISAAVTGVKYFGGQPWILGFGGTTSHLFQSRLSLDSLKAESASIGW